MNSCVATGKPRTLFPVRVEASQTQAHLVGERRPALNGIQLDCYTVHKVWCGRAHVDPHHCGHDAIHHTVFEVNVACNHYTCANGNSRQLVNLAAISPTQHTLLGRDVFCALCKKVEVRNASVLVALGCLKREWSESKRSAPAILMVELLRFR